DSFGLYTTATGDNAVGVYADSVGINGTGLYAHASGTGGDGIYALSAVHYGIFAETDAADNQYGVFTPDKMSALAYDTNSGDVAEYMAVAGSPDPGTVLVIGADGILLPSAKANDTKVAGIVSTAPGVSLGVRNEGNTGEILVAVAGLVPCKADATGAPIHAGDLLTTSGYPGYAMKAEPVRIDDFEFYLPGTILGKAMGSLESGTGTIEVLVTLQ
ncbi:MAG: hypothetical protein LUQ25_03065, partial [Methanoregulaceae archaeon]|nr:hypothetical protein [Methanoregulaceae archaeon]